MARKSKGSGKGKESNKKRKKKGPNSTNDVRKTKSMEEVLGILPIQFSDDEYAEENTVMDPESLAPVITDNILEFQHSRKGTNSISPPVLHSGSRQVSKGGMKLRSGVSSGSFVAVVDSQSNLQKLGVTEDSKRTLKKLGGIGVPSGTQDCEKEIQSTPAPVEVQYSTRKGMNPITPSVLYSGSGQVSKGGMKLRSGDLSRSFVSVVDPQSKSKKVGKAVDSPSTLKNINGMVAFQEVQSIAESELQNNKQKVKISVEDIEDEVHFWSSAMIC